MRNRGRVPLGGVREFGRRIVLPTDLVARLAQRMAIAATARAAKAASEADRAAAATLTRARRGVADLPKWIDRELATHGKWSLITDRRTARFVRRLVLCAGVVEADLRSKLAPSRSANERRRLRRVVCVRNRQSAYSRLACLELAHYHLPCCITK